MVTHYHLIKKLILTIAPLRHLHLLMPKFINIFFFHAFGFLIINGFICVSTTSLPNNISCNTTSSDNLSLIFFKLNFYHRSPAEREDLCRYTSNYRSLLNAIYFVSSYEKGEGNWYEFTNLKILRA